jgi:UDP-N-acetyl-D-mannosaminuronic acid dehydrogenase
MHFPGAGVGGHCLPKDTWLLIHGYEEYAKHKNQYPSSIMKDARYLNDWMPIHVADLLESALKKANKALKGSRICVLGYSFLENSDDPRNTPTIPFLLELRKRGATYQVHDPYVKEDEGYKLEQDIDIALKDCDAVVLMTKHDEYKSINPKKLMGLLRTKVIIDGRNLFNPTEFIDKGFIFMGVGKGNIKNSRVGVKSSD